MSVCVASRKLIVKTAPRVRQAPPSRLERASAFPNGGADGDTPRPAGRRGGRRAKMAARVVPGRQRPAKDGPPIRKDALFLIASITKPVTVGAALMLVERGLFTL